MADPDRTFLRELVNHHVSGQLKVAPEHVSDKVLRCMGKPGGDVYDRFVEAYTRENEKAGKKQFLVPLPYVVASGIHPQRGCRACGVLPRSGGICPSRCRISTRRLPPSPPACTTPAYDPRTMQPVYVPRSAHEKALQRALIQYRNPANYDLVHEALVRAGRRDLIGYGEKCLIRPRKHDGSTASRDRGSSSCDRAIGAKGRAASQGAELRRARRQVGESPEARTQPNPPPVPQGGKGPEEARSGKRGSGGARRASEGHARRKGGSR